MKSNFFPLTEGVYYILLAIKTPLHGYGIMQKVEGLSNGRVCLAAGTLYGAISALLEKKWISCVNPDLRKKEYELTPQGMEVLKEEIIRLRELLENGEKIMEDKCDVHKKI